MVVWTYRAAVMVAWLAALLWLVSYGESAVWAMLLVSVAAGFLANTWWVLTVPALVVVWFTLSDVFESGSEGDLTAFAVFVLSSIFSAVAAVALASGVALRRRLDRRRRGGGRDQPPLRSTYAR